MHIPSSTYRVQLHKGFTFLDLEKIIDYLHTLGVSTIYAAPIFKSTPGSMHGYDVTDPHTINPEIGTLDELRSLSLKLKAKNMSWLQDIVPNHMAFATDNFRLMDVLERGPHSAYYNYFDINWNHPTPALQGKVTVPFLGKELEECVNKHEIKITWSENGFHVSYFETHYPLSVKALDYLIQDTGNDTLKNLFTQYSDHASASSTLKLWDTYKKNWIADLNKQASITDEIHQILSRINNDQLKIKDLLDTQYYTLTFWQHSEKEINYRRFFTVNELICLRMEDDIVFDEYHKLLDILYQENIIQGLRIDHIDGLNDPARYLEKLRKRFGDGMYIIAEKILEAKEDIPASWPLQGTSGYEFLSHVNQLLTDKKGARQLTSLYRELVPGLPPLKELVFNNKKIMLEKYMGGEWNNLLYLLDELGLTNGLYPDRLKEALGLIMISLPVYRIYPDTLPLQGKDLVLIKETFEKAALADQKYQPELDHLYNLLTQDTGEKKAALKFLRRFMQFTGPLTAKGVEDTTFYVYNALISHDEVGDTPANLGISTQEFHAKMTSRNKNSSLSLNATTTHDTKRGEDARIRLNALSQIPGIWQKYVREWFVMNRKFHREAGDRIIPTANDEYFIYQSIVGGFPEDNIVTQDWIDRLKAYLVKAMREAKINSNWTSPEEVYEAGCTGFAEDILKDAIGFLPSFTTLIKEVLKLATHNSLIQTLVKCTAPGIPDVYQGCELFDLSFVDPDNRRPIDFNKRETYLALLQEHEKESLESLFNALLLYKHDGFEKLFVTWKILNFRRQNPALFIEGNYQALQISGQSKDIIAYGRNTKDRFVLAIISMSPDINAEDQNTYVMLPESFPGQWTDLFTHQVHIFDKKIYLNTIFKKFPMALLHS